MPSTLSEDRERIKLRDRRNPLYSLAVLSLAQPPASVGRIWSDDLIDQFMSPAFAAGTPRPFQAGGFEHSCRRFIPSLPSFAAPGGEGVSRLVGYVALYHEFASKIAGSSITALHIGAAFSKPNLCSSIEKHDPASTTADRASDVLVSAFGSAPCRLSGTGGWHRRASMPTVCSR